MLYPSDDVVGMRNYSHISNSMPSFHLPVMDDQTFIRYFYEVDDKIRVVRRAKDDDSYIPNTPHNIDSFLREMEQQAKTNYDIAIPFLSKHQKNFFILMGINFAMLYLGYNITPEILNLFVKVVLGLNFAMISGAFVLMKVGLLDMKKDVLRYKFYLDHKEEFENLPILELQNYTIDINIIAMCNLSLEQLKGYLETTKEEPEEKTEEKVKNLVYNIFHQNEENS